MLVGDGTKMGQYDAAGKHKTRPNFHNPFFLMMNDE